MDTPERYVWLCLRVARHIDDFVGSYNTRAVPFVWTKAVVHQKRLKPRLSDL